MRQKLTLILLGLGALSCQPRALAQGGQSTNIRVVSILPSSCTPGKGSIVMYQDRQYYCDSTGHYVPGDPGKGITDGNAGAAVTTTPYPVACDVNSLPIDRSSTLRLKSGASVVTVPDSTASGCTGGMTFALLDDGAGVVTVNRSASDTFTVLNGSSAVDGATSFTLSNGHYATLSNGATNIWEVRIVAGRVQSCTELWGGSGTSFALTSGDDAISNNSCYNDSGATRTITAVKCRSDNASNTTTVDRKSVV